MKKKATPKLKTVTNQSDWGKGLEGFRQRYSLSLRDLSGIFSTPDRLVSRDTLHRLCRGTSEPKSSERLRPLMIEQIRGYLKKLKKSEDAIHKELCTIFCKEEIEPVLTQRAVLPKGAQNYFGLRFDPFTVDPRTRAEVFTTPQLDRISNQLEDAINYQQFVAVIGEIGAGKSLTKRRIVDSCLNSKGKMQIFWPEFMNMEKVHSGSITSYLLRKFGQTSPRDLVLRADRLKEQLAALADEGVRIALGFDECHRLDPRLLTALKNFWELGSGGYDRYLGLILFGQPRFEMTLRNLEFREITERLDIIHLPNLGHHAWDYVAHRLKVAGANAEKLFDRDSVAKLAEIGPTPLALGNLCNTALLKAQQIGEKRVHKGVLKAAGLDLNGEPKVRGIRTAQSA